LVTGGGVGIGRGVVLALARVGADVALTYHSHDGAAVESEVEALGRRAKAIQMDAVDSASVCDAVNTAARALGAIDFVVNNAGGLIARQSLREMTDEHWHLVLELNLTSAFYVTRAALPHMTRPGSIVNISSLAGRNGGGDGASAYAAAKAGMVGWTRALAKELGPEGITVNAVAPGLILDTPFHEAFTPPEGQRATIESTPLRRAGYPADVAGAVVYLVSELGSFTTGSVLDINGGTYFA
jgi:3-oxoacyl-[acyl-carrier protein] reductase